MDNNAVLGVIDPIIIVNSTNIILPIKDIVKISYGK
jgi:hypothetical protein